MSETVTRDAFTEAMRRVPPWGTGLLVVTALLIYGFETAFGGATDLAVLVRLGALFAPIMQAHAVSTASASWVPHGQGWRLLSSLFLHVGLLDLAVNLCALLAVGPICEGMFGTPRFLALFAFAGLASSLASTLFLQSLSAGACGAMFGILGAVALIGYKMRGHLPRPLKRRYVVTLVPFVVYALLFKAGVGTAGNPMLDNAGLLGGLMGGLIFATVIPPTIVTRMQTEQPDTRELKDVFLLAFGLLPFACLIAMGAYASTHANLLDSPPTSYHGAGLHLTLPAVFMQDDTREGVVLRGPALSLQAESFTQQSPVSLKDCKSALDVGVRQAEQLGFKAARESSATQVNGRTWFWNEGRASNGDVVLTAASAFGSSLALVTVTADVGHETDARRLLELAQRTLILDSP